MASSNSDAVAYPVNAAEPGLPSRNQPGQSVRTWDPAGRRRRATRLTRGARLRTDAGTARSKPLVWDPFCSGTHCSGTCEWWLVAGRRFRAK